jgi:nitrilase
MDATKLIGAVAQTSTVLLDTPATVQRALDLMRDAAASGAQLLVFPEAYHRRLSQGGGLSHLLGARTPQGPRRVQALF